jgi:hypothetical protein
MYRVKLLSALLFLFCFLMPQASWALSFPWSKSKSDPQFIIPLDCKLNDDCFVIYYPDRNPGPSYRDYRCGSLSLDNNRATVFAVKKPINRVSSSRRKG